MGKPRVDEVSPALRSLCDTASRQAHEWDHGVAPEWTEARATHLAAARHRRLLKLGVAGGVAALVIGALAAEFGDPATAPPPSAEPPAPIRFVAAPAPVATPAPMASPAPEEIAPSVAAPPAGEPAAPSAARALPEAEPAAVAPSPPAASDEPVSQPDGAC